MFRQILLAAAVSLAFRGTWATVHERDQGRRNTIERDIAIIGGGASGTYAAVRLREDYKKSVVVVEPKDHFGGHVNTYTVPETGTTLEYGVQSYMRYGQALEFFARFNVSVIPFSSRRLTGINVDITNGKLITGYAPPPAADTTAAFAVWLSLVDKYKPFLEPGLWDFYGPDEIPSELLIPLKDFVKLHNVEAALPRIMQISNIGVGGVADLLTFHVIMAFGPTISESVVNSTLVWPAVSNSLVYQRAYDLLKKDVLLNTLVIDAKREHNKVELTVQNTDGTKTTIKVKRLLISAPPSLANLQPFQLDGQELSVYNTWEPTWSFVGVAKIPCIPENYSVSYLPSSVVPNHHLAVRDYKYTLRFDSTGPPGLQLFRILFATNYTITNDEAKATVLDNIQNLVKSGTVNATNCPSEIKAFDDHNTIVWNNDVKLLREGFVQDLYALQGHRSTWYTGQLWCEHYSSNVWAFTETVIPRLLKGL